MERISRTNLFLKISVLILIASVFSEIIKTEFIVILTRNFDNSSLLLTSLAGLFFYLLLPIGLIPAIAIMLMTVISDTTRKIIIYTIPLITLLMLGTAIWLVNVSCKLNSHYCDLLALFAGYTKLYLIISSVCLFVIFLLKRNNGQIKFDSKAIRLFFILIVITTIISEMIWLPHEITQYLQEDKRKKIREQFTNEFVIYAPEYLPPGIAEKPDYINHERNNMSYKCTDTKYGFIQLWQESIGTSSLVSIDDIESTLKKSSDYYSTFERVTIHEKPALYTVRGSQKQLHFINDGITFTFTVNPNPDCNLTNVKDELIKMAESLKPTGEKASMPYPLYLKKK